MRHAALARRVAQLEQRLPGGANGRTFLIKGMRSLHEAIAEVTGERQLAAIEAKGQRRGMAALRAAVEEEERRLAEFLQATPQPRQTPSPSKPSLKRRNPNVVWNL